MIISIPVNYICNLSCKYCYFDKNSNKYIDKIIVNKIILDIVKNISFNEKIDFFLDMKEPFLTPHLIKLIILQIEKYCKKYNYWITIYTNWTLEIKKEIIVFLLKRKNIWFHISLDGINNFERWITSIQFMKIINNITLIKKYFNYNIWYVIDDYTSTLTYKNFLNIYLFFIKLNFLNVSFYRKRMIWISWNISEYWNYIIWFLQIKKFILEINNTRFKLWKLILNDTHLWILFDWIYWCWALKNNILWYDLLWNKNFCSESIGQWEINYKSSLLKVNLFKKSKCIKCEIRKFCNSPCILEWDYKCIFLKLLHNFKINNFKFTNNNLI